MANVIITVNSNADHYCQHCGQVVESEDELYSVTVGYGRYQHWCEECRDTYATVCERCGENVAINMVEDVHASGDWTTDEWCPNCASDHATECEECRELYANEYIHTITLWNGESVTICGDCLDENYRRCTDCGNYVYNDDVEYDNYDDAYCPSCISRHRRSDNLTGYHHTYGGWFWGDDGNAVSEYNMSDEDRHRLYLGIELECDEVDDVNGLADDIASDYDSTMLECKEDGSLDEGLEVVTQPMTPKYHLTSDLWEGVTEHIRNHGGKSHNTDTCGLHIHGSKGFFTDEDAVYRLDRLFHRHQRNLIKFSRRRGYMMRWCSLDGDNLADVEDIEKRKEMWKDEKKWADRYEAVNTRNSATVEIRLWRGTLNMETLRATIELTTGLFIIANTISDELAEKLTWKMLILLIRYALERADLPHDDLDAYLERRGL